MPLRYCSFISYRHCVGYKGQTFTERIVEDLKAELELRVTQQVFRDVERLKGAEFYHEELASALCMSVCMVVLYWPTYFSDEHAFCAREFKAMESLEAKRLKLLPRDQRTKGLIIVVALRGFESIPSEIRQRRLCKDFEAYTLKPDMREDPGFQSDIFEISKYIADRVNAFKRLAKDPFTGCDSFRLPPEKEIIAWIKAVSHPGLPFANREIVA